MDQHGTADRTIVNYPQSEVLRAIMLDGSPYALHEHQLKALGARSGGAGAEPDRFNAAAAPLSPLSSPPLPSSLSVSLGFCGARGQARSLQCRCSRATTARALSLSLSLCPSPALPPADRALRARVKRGRGGGTRTSSGGVRSRETPCPPASGPRASPAPWAAATRGH